MSQKPFSEAVPVIWADEVKDGKVLTFLQGLVEEGVLVSEMLPKGESTIRQFRANPMTVKVASKVDDLARWFDDEMRSFHEAREGHFKLLNTPEDKVEAIAKILASGGTYTPRSEMYNFYDGAWNGVRKAKEQFEEVFKEG